MDDPSRPSPVRPARAPRPRRSLVARLAIGVFALLLAAGVLGATVVVAGFVTLSRGLGDPAEELANLEFPEQSVIYDRTGEVELARFGEFQREVVTWEELPPFVVDAVTAVEDRTFWENSGFDPLAIVAAGIDTIRGQGRGASTITQQLVRQRLLDEELVQDPDRTVERKLKEIIQSVRLTQAFPGEEGKRDIMTAYLNQNFFGNDSYGIKAAAKSYFGVTDLNDLTLAQAAILAALPQSPSSYDLVRNAVATCGAEVPEGEECPAADVTLTVPPDTKIVQRRNLVLDLMEQGRTPLSDDAGEPITAAEFDAAREEPVVLARQTVPRWRAPHFVWAVREELTRALCGEEAQTCDALERGGLRIRTTLDWDLQRIAERWVKLAAIAPKSGDPLAYANRIGFELDELPEWVARLRDKELGNGALVAMDYQTGEVVAYVGSADYYARANEKRQPQFDVLADGWRQPGSAFKPFLYAIGIDERRLTSGTMFMDVVTDFGGGYTPTDADNLERGPVRVRDALRFSLNIPAVKATAVLEPARVFARSQELGLRFQTQEVDAGSALGLGVEEVHPADLVTGYSTIANGGAYIGRTTILEVKDRAGNEVVPPYSPPEAKQVISPEAAWIMTDILRGNTNPDVNPFWGRFRIPGREATLKTGTNNDARDLNAYGYIAAPTSEGREAGEYALAVGAWNGNSDNSLASTPEAPLFSIDVTTYVWQGFLREATDGWTERAFPERPEGVTVVEVDPWTGLLPPEGGRSVPETYIAGTEPTERAGGSGDSCGAGLFGRGNFENRSDAWMQANRDWLARAEQGPGVRGGPERTATSYFYNNRFQPYGASWGPILGGEGCASPTPSIDPCASPSGSIDPSAAPAEPSIPVDASGNPIICPSPSPTPTPSELLSPSIEITLPPIETLPPPPVETPPPTPEPTPPPTPEPTPPPTEPPPSG